MTEQTDGDKSPPDPTPSGPDDPSLEIPDQAVPGQESPSLEQTASNVDPELQAQFWKIVLLLKLSIIGITVGTLLLIFLPTFAGSLPVLLAGLVLFAYTVREGRQFKAHAAAGTFDDTGESTSEGTDQ